MLNGDGTCLLIPLSTKTRSVVIDFFASAVVAFYEDGRGILYRGILNPVSKYCTPIHDSLVLPVFTREFGMGIQ